MSDTMTFIKDAGGCVLSKNILSGKGKLKWCVREMPINNIDNGWRFFSDIDSEEYLSDASNMTICDFNTVVNIEPAILLIYSLPIGADIELKENDGKKVFVDNNTGAIIHL